LDHQFAQNYANFLPAQREIILRVERYQKVLLNMDDTGRRQPGWQALYQMLVAPAAKLIRVTLR